MDSGEERALGLSRCRDPWVTKEGQCSMARLSRGVRPGGRAETGQRLGHRGTLWKWIINRDPENLLGSWRELHFPWELEKKQKTEGSGELSGH